MSLLTLDEINKVSSDLKKIDVTWVDMGEEVKTHIYIKKLNFIEAKEQRKRFARSVDKEESDDEQMERMLDIVCSFACDENGEKLYTPEDILGESERNQKPFPMFVVNALFEAVFKAISLGEAQSSPKKK